MNQTNQATVRRNDLVDSRQKWPLNEGQTYENSIYYHRSLYCDDKTPATYEVSLGGKFSRLEALAGISATGANARTKIEIDMPARWPHPTPSR